MMDDSPNTANDLFIYGTAAAVASIELDCVAGCAPIEWRATDLTPERSTGWLIRNHLFARQGPGWGASGHACSEWYSFFGEYENELAA